MPNLNTDVQPDSQSSCLFHLMDLQMDAFPSSSKHLNGVIGTLDQVTTKCTDGFSLTYKRTVSAIEAYVISLFELVGFIATRTLSIFFEAIKLQFTAALETLKELGITGGKALIFSVVMPFIIFVGIFSPKIYKNIAPEVPQDRIPTDLQRLINTLYDLIKRSEEVDSSDQEEVDLSDKQEAAPLTNMDKLRAIEMAVISLHNETVATQVVEEEENGELEALRAENQELKDQLEVQRSETNGLRQQLEGVFKLLPQELKDEVDTTLPGGAPLSSLLGAVYQYVTQSVSQSGGGVQVVASGDGDGDDDARSVDGDNNDKEGFESVDGSDDSDVGSVHDSDNDGVDGGGGDDDDGSSVGSGSVHDSDDDSDDDSK